jgi:hypothetical protein
MLRSITSRFKAGKTLFLITIAIVALSIYLYTQPAYNEVHQKFVQVIQTYNVNKNEFKIDLLGSEYLDSVKIKHGGKDTLLLEKTLSASIVPTVPFDTSRFKIVRDIKKTKSNDTTYFDVNLKLDSKLIPYKVDISYNGGENFRKSLKSNWKFKDNKKGIELKWYSYPKMPLIIPVKFFGVGTDTVKEEIKITYSDLFYPMEFGRELTNFIKRTVVKEIYKYQR